MVNLEKIAESVISGKAEDVKNMVQQALEQLKEVNHYQLNKYENSKQIYILNMR